MILTKRDLNLFKSLHSYGLLTTSVITDSMFSGIATTTVLRRLRLLEREGMLRRITLPERGALAWAVLEPASKMVSEIPPKKTFRPDLLDHDLKLVELRLALEDAGIAKSWIPEHEIRHKVFKHHGVRYSSSLLVPDGIMGVESFNDENQAIAIELELNFKNLSRYERIFWDYRSRKTLAAILYVVSHPAIGKAALNAWKKTNRTESKVEFYWVEFEKLMRIPQNFELNSLIGAQATSTLWKSDLGAQGAAHGVSSLEVENHEYEIAANLS